MLLLLFYIYLTAGAAAPPASRPVLPGALPFVSPTPPSFWQPVPAAQARRLGLPRLRPSRYQVLRLDLPGLKKALAAATDQTGPLVRLPLPDGALATYQLRLSTVMAPELAARYPNLRTYAGQEPGHPANDVRLELTTAGLRAMLIRNGHTYFIEPYCPGDTQHYICFDKDQLPAGSKKRFEAPGS
ncbi:hypothetical protein E5K00_10865 [Hymenobacter aquaticus]|uniref:Uncharacterized protein n=1 Tax=Hymenobacter aquaticus TaxID=1867101 RepID=A0A4Z0QAA9_9BACT|nr:hypothetical protein [Hymenobacter aquaticus]TGE25662.1 hypothetical protein E5K00_10865 [Hymenobacter aquaticus]